ncbi:hypothetical protein OX283_004670 [Flavobacterium sp. SUN052]|uniref:hypothetical protein n=1 Tax=Flavobacterium sp. SUN052 TaxID=3002441 RepID=UPI00237DFD2A|nr:hypothetical protein [Flavobacterium sp. SUN052]MEC4003939.1 hypothetical protein [Flavobacterium sp. SUN052]
MKKNNFLLLMLFILTYNLSFSQLKEVYEKGKIMLKNGNKIEGYIKQDELGKLVEKIYFKNSLEDKNYEIYSTTQINSFLFSSGEAYELLTVKLNHNKDEVTLFANLLVKGKVSLYKSFYLNEPFFIINNANNNFALQNDKFDSGDTEIGKYHYKAYIDVATEGFAKTHETISYSEKDFIKIITEYNIFLNSESKIISASKKSINFLIATIGTGIPKNDGKEVFFQGIYRIYFPKISRSTSLNVGLTYYNYKFSVTDDNILNPQKSNYTSNLISIPFQVQQNFLNKKIRPYINAGLNVSYIKTLNQNDISIFKNDLQNNFGIGIIYGGGIEADLYKGLVLKVEGKYEIFSHLLLVGIGYNFSKK